jgi:hypothetical protein
MPKYEIDLGAWLILEAESEDEAFAIAHNAIDMLRTAVPEFDGEVAGVLEVYED